MEDDWRSKKSYDTILHSDYLWVGTTTFYLKGERQYYEIDGDEPWLDKPGRNLKMEAKSLRHQMLHDGANPHCELCKQAKAIRKANERRTEVKIPDRFGDIVTCDHVYAHSEDLEGITGDRDLLVVYDVGTGCLAAYPVKNKSTQETAKRLTHFRARIPFVSSFPTNTSP